MSKVELSRRGFLKGTLAATGAAMAGTAAHAGDILKSGSSRSAAAGAGKNRRPRLLRNRLKRQWIPTLW